MYDTSNTLSEDIRSKSAELFNQHLTAAIDLHAQVRQAHWNVRGPAFIAIHELLERSRMRSRAIRLRSLSAAALGSTAEGTIRRLR